MAMNKARRTANLNNILTYDTLGNSTLIANLTVEGLTGAGFVKADAAGLLSVDTAAYTVVTGATNYLTKITAPNTLGQSLVYDNGTSVYINTAVGVPGYSHAFQVMANGAGGLVVSTTDVASAIGIVNSSSANKTWDISPYGNHLVINESGIATRMKFDAGGNITIGDITNSGHKLEVVGSFRTTGTNTLSALQGVGDRMVVANTNGVLTTQPIPTGSITGTGAAGQVNFWTGTTTVSGSNNLFWNNAQGRLGIGTNAPEEILTISSANPVLRIRENTGVSTSGSTIKLLNSVNNESNISFSQANYTPVNRAKAAQLLISNNGTGGIVLNAASADANATIDFVTQSFPSGFSSVLCARITNAGNLLIGFSGEQSARLAVSGDTLLRGSGNTSATFALTVQNSDSTNMFRVRNDNFVFLQNIFPLSAASLNIYHRENIGSGIVFGPNAPTTLASGIRYTVVTNDNFFPASGNASYAVHLLQPTINQTGGANGFTRGLYILPTLTAAADWRSIQWDNNSGWGLYGAGTANNLLNGRLYIPAGSYDLPSLSFVNDTNTGLFSPLADNIELKTGTNNAVVLENQGINLMEYSEALGAFPTNFQQVSVSIPGNVAAPDGTLTANIAVPDTSLNQHRFYRIYSTTLPFTMSVYAKAAGYNFISLGWSGGVNGEAIIFDLVNGTISGSAANHTATIENVGNGWFRCSLSYTASAAPGSYSRWIIVRNANSTASYSGDGTSGVYVWGWQMEENTASTSYTKTGATAVTRPQAISLLGQNLYGNLITRRVTGPSQTDLSFATSFTDRMTIHRTSGNVMINSSSDLGQRLQVMGDVFIRGTGNTNATNALAVQNSDSLNLFRQQNNGTILLGSSANAPRIFSSNASGLLDINGDGLTFSNPSIYNSPSSGSFNFTGDTFVSTSGFNSVVSIYRQFLPSSGNAGVFYLNIVPTVNQSAGGTGRTVGIRISPNLTSPADWRSIDIENSVGWGIYGSGTANNYLAGSLGIGSTANLSSRTLSIVKNITGAITAYSVVNDGQVQSDVTGNATGFFNGINTQNAAFTLANYMHFDAQQGTIGASSTVTNQYGFRAASSLTTGTNIFGFRGDIASGTGRWNIYMNGTANNYMAGALGIGSTGLTGYSIRVSRAITGNTISSSIVTDSVIQSDVTNMAHGYYSGLYTAAASFTLDNLRHFYAEAGTFGAGSTVATQIGFGVSSNLTAATNNYGFFGGIPAAANRWNLYMAGTAANYLNGNTIIGGTATDDGINKLQVSGSISATADSVINGVTIGKGGGSGALNTAVGSLALSANTTGASNTAFGLGALATITTGSDNVAVGTNAGRYRNGTTSNIDSSGGVYIGNASRASATATTNEIVIGAGAQGAGNNTVTIGNTGIVSTTLRGNVTTNGSITSSITQTATASSVSISLLGSNITSYAAGFSMVNLGYGLNAMYAQHEQRFGGNATFAHGNLNGAGLLINKLAPTAAGTVTITQQSGQLRTMSNLHLMTQFDGNNNLTVTDMSGLHIYGHYRTSGTGTLTVSNAYYGIFLADPNEFGTGATITGTNWGFYQQGTAPINAFQGSMLVGTTTTDANNRLVVSGNTRVTGNTTSAQFRLSALNTAPATSTSTGTTGEIVIDANHIYVCTATNTWKRVAIATF